MSWFGTQPTTLAGELMPAGPALGTMSLLLGETGSRAKRNPVGRVRGARPETRGPGASRYALLDRVGGKRWGELPAAPPAGRHTSPPRFATDTARVTGKSDPSANRAGVVIIAPPRDLLAQLVATSLLYAHVPTCQLDPAELADVQLEWHGNEITISGQTICGLLWRAPRTDDKLSALDPQITASWLAAASFPSMRAVNAYDPTAWRQGAGWSVWKDRLGECGVPVQPPPERHSASPGTLSLIACGAVVAGPKTPCISAAAAALESSGVRLATVTSLPDGRVSNVDAQPEVNDSLQARRAAAKIADYLAAA
ncbi:MAG: hypothetical protein OEP52_05090 [Acidimicrobiia bacterium]|nr:hypothetical protein [Acidimicrobiia bacterium]